MLISDERARRSILLNESLKDHAKSRSSLHTGNSYAKGDDLVVTVDSSEDTHSVLTTIGTYLLDQVVGEVIANSLTIS